MSGRVVGWAYRQKTGSPTAKAVLVKIAENANEEGEAWPSIDRMVRETELSRRTVLLKLRELEELGLIRTEHTRNGQRQGVNHYWLAYNSQGASDASENSQGASDAPQGASGASVRVQDVHPNRHREPSKNRQGDSPPDDGDELDADFELWWKLVPRKAGKGQARKAYRAARKKADAATLSAGIEAYAALVKRKRTEPHFIAHPTTWLNGERWLDEEPPPPTEPDFFEM